jgi:hypothetical protein
VRLAIAAICLAKLYKGGRREGDGRGKENSMAFPRRWAGVYSDGEEEAGMGSSVALEEISATIGWRRGRKAATAEQAACGQEAAHNSFAQADTLSITEISCRSREDE